MSELSLRFTSENDSAPIFVSMFRPDSGASTNPVAFTPPLTDPQLVELRWYLESSWHWPTPPDFERAEKIENDLENWGKALLASVLVTPNAGDHPGSPLRGIDPARLWQQFLDQPTTQLPNHPTTQLVTIDATDPRVLRLPWELLADEGGHVFARGIGIRRRLQQATQVAPAQTFELPVRVLVVVSRPDDAGFIDPRSETIPLLNALDELGDQATVEFLDPPTLSALDARLRDRRKPRVHVVHFDGHGVYDQSIGLGFLLFEDDAHKSDRVDAHQLGTLLYGCGVPLIALNACQSAAQKDTNPYASVAARLIRAGVGSVLAMNYSVLVVAAQKFVGAFYAGLAGGVTIGQAVDDGRRVLLREEKRHTLIRRNEQGDQVEQTLRLRDWFLPALYQQAGDPVVFDDKETRRQGDKETGRDSLSVSPGHRVSLSALPADLPPEPLHRFHGRSRELLAIERAFAAHRVVVLHGFGGVGKTTLAAEAGRWFTRTGRFPGGVAFVSFELGGSLQQLCSWVGQTLTRDPNFVIGDGDPVERIAALLRERPALVILDNFESVLGRAPLMPADELRAVLDAVWGWGQGDKETRRQGDQGSKILITTRDVTFHDLRFSPSAACAHIELGGLAESDALDLAASVLNDHGIDRARIKREDLCELMERLGGHPLSLYLALPHLRALSPRELMARYEQLLPGFTQGKAQARNESLAVSLNYSLTRLGEQTRAALPSLGVFQGGAMEDDLLAITEMDAELWKTARAELQAAALVKVEPLRNINVPFLQFHPTLLPYLATQLDDARRAKLHERYWQAYYQLANQLYQSDTQHPIEARAIVVREMPNLRRALDLALDAGAMDEAVGFAARISRFLDYFGRWRERDEMMEQVKSKNEKVKSADGKLTKSEYLLASQRGDAMWQQGHAAEAERLFRDLLKRMDAGVAYDVEYDRAMTFWRLGRCLEAQGRPAQAIEWHHQALQVFERLSATDKDAKKNAAVARTDLANNLVATGKFGEAEKEYAVALEVARAVDDSRQVGVTLAQLGTLAMQRGDLKTAHERHTDALNTFRAMGEQQSEAVSWHQLGVVAQEEKQWDEAERCYRESLKLEEQMNHAEGVAQTCNQLAVVAKGAGRLADAERWYLRALDAFEKLNDPGAQAKVLNNLANLYLAQRRLDEAERYARRAVAIKETLDVSAEPWKSHSILADILVARGNAAEAVQWRRKEQDSFAAYAGAAYQLPEWAGQFVQLVGAAMQGSEKDSETVGQFLAQMDDERSAWRNLAAAVRRILNGETDFEKLRDELDYQDAYIVWAILGKDEGGGQRSAVSGHPSPNSNRASRSNNCSAMSSPRVSRTRPPASPRNCTRSRGNWRGTRKCQTKFARSAMCSTKFSPASARRMSRHCRRNSRTRCKRCSRN